MNQFPTITAPKPSGFDTWSPDNRDAYLKEEARGFKQMACPNCKMKSKRLFRCSQHRNWGK